jgi:hypothetical protein
MADNIATLYSLLVTIIFYLGILLYYSIKKPSFIKEVNSDGDSVVSVRLATVYSLLFSSAIGLLSFTIVTGYKYLNQTK